MSILRLSTLLVIFPLVVSSQSLSLKNHYTTNNGLPGDQVRNLLLLADGRIIAGTNNGPVILDGQKWSKDFSEVSSVSTGIASLFQTSTGQLWYGGLGNAHLIEGEELITFSINDDMKLNGRVVFSFFEGDDGIIWVGTTGGLALLEGSSWKTITTEDGLNNNVIHDINQDKNGNYILATRKGGLNIFDGNSWSSKYTDRNARKLFRDSSGLIWVGTASGLLKYDTDEWISEGDVILPLTEDRNGNVWCVSQGSNITIVDSSNLTTVLTDPTDGKVGEIYSLLIDPHNSLWMATDKGVFEFVIE